MIIKNINPESLENRIGRLALDTGVDPLSAQSIAWAESRFDPNAKNKTPGSTASGIYQFINDTFQDYCIDKYKMADSMTQKNDPYIQIDCALKIMKEDSIGINHWKASKSMWSSYKR